MASFKGRAVEQNPSVERPLISQDAPCGLNSPAARPLEKTRDRTLSAQHPWRECQLHRT
jgi:hypothetical protein